MKSMILNGLELPLTLVIASAVLSGPGSAQTKLLEIIGDTNDQLEAVANVGDIDGDEVDDFVCAASNHYQLAVYSGRTGQERFEHAGPGAGTVTGLGIAGALCGIGDLDGDGTPDYAAGEIGYDINGTPATLSGAVWAFSGVDGSLIAAAIGHSVTEQYGYQVAALGDVDGDGFPDVGATTYASNRVDVLGGPDLHLIRSHLGPNPTRPAVGGIGDADGDGTADYLVGWSDDSTMGTWTGKVELRSGRTGAVLLEVFGETPHGGGLTGDHLGVSVTGVGDVDLDGVPDFTAGASGDTCYPSCLPFPSTRSWVRAYSGADGHVIHHWEGEVETGLPGGRRFGHYVYGGGDVNGDGVPDVLVSSPLAPDPRGSINAYSGASGERLWQVVGETFNAELSAAAILGDLNQDGICEFAVGDDAFGSPDPGKVTIYAGAPGGLEHHCAADPPPPVRIDASGPISVGNDQLTLLGSGASPGQLAVFFYGPPAPRLPFADGWLCTGPPRFRLPVTSVAPDGTASLPLDFSQPPLAGSPGAIHPGSTWSFQLFCRDPQGGAGTMHLSDGLSILFPP